MANKALTQKAIEQLATEVFNWLVDKEMWVDTVIYFNGKCWSTNNKDCTEFCYNERKYFEYEADPRNHFDYVREPNILSMSFEGDLYDVLNGYSYGWVKNEEEFRKIFERYGLYFELGNAWNLSCYEI